MQSILLLNFGYELMNKVMKIIKENPLKIKDRKMEVSCELQISVRKSEVAKILGIFERMYPLKICQVKV